MSGVNQFSAGRLENEGRAQLPLRKTEYKWRLCENIRPLQQESSGYIQKTQKQSKRLKPNAAEVGVAAEMTKETSFTSCFFLLCHCPPSQAAPFVQPLLFLVEWQHCKTLNNNTDRKNAFGLVNCRSHMTFKHKQFQLHKLYIIVLRALSLIGTKTSNIVFILLLTLQKWWKN